MILVLDKRVKKKSKFVLELQKVYGLNKSTLLEVCRKFGLSHDIRVYEVPEFILRRVVRYIKHYYLVNTELSNKLLEEIRLEKSIRSYKGYRRFLKLPLNGQRTKTNRKTVKRIL